MARPRKADKDKTVTMGFTAPIPLRDWFFKNHPEKTRSAVLTKLLATYKEQIEATIKQQSV